MTDKQITPEQHEIHEGVFRCPNGCDFDELEIGTESESFGALIGLPYQRIRCGKCGFAAEPGQGRDSAIEKWNASAVAKARGEA